MSGHAFVNPFAMSGGMDGSASFGTSVNHGGAEHGSRPVYGSDFGGHFGMTPPRTPRTSASPRRETGSPTGPRSGGSPVTARSEAGATSKTNLS